MLGGGAGGVWTSLDDLKLPTLVAPQDAMALAANLHGIYDDMYAIYKKLYPALRTSMADLSRVGGAAA